MFLFKKSKDPLEIFEEVVMSSKISVVVKRSLRKAIAYCQNAPNKLYQLAEICERAAQKYHQTTGSNRLDLEGKANELKETAKIQEEIERKIIAKP